MKEEIKAGVDFIREFLAKYGQLTALQIDQFATKLATLLHERYANHWYETQPLKGQAFRCVRLKRAENYMDPSLEIILRECGLSLSQLGLPNDFTLWIDPGEVSVRFGDQVGYTYTLAKFAPKEVVEANKEEEEKEVSPPNSAKLVVVQKSEQIFDEKLTAFIRQNSSQINVATTTSPLTSVGDKLKNGEEFGEEEEAAKNELLMDEEDMLERMTTLSAEMRTISPPVGSPPQSMTKLPVKRTNSSTIAINSASAKNKMGGQNNVGMESSVLFGNNNR